METCDVDCRLDVNSSQVALDLEIVEQHVEIVLEIKCSASLVFALFSVFRAWRKSDMLRRRLHFIELPFEKDFNSI